MRKRVLSILHKPFLVLASWLCCAVSAHAAWPPPAPARVSLSVRNTTEFNRELELVRGGVPFARERGLTSTAGFAVIDAQGVAIPATFQVLARWHGGRSSGEPLQWVLVRFVTSVPAGSTRTFTLRTDGSVSNPPPATSLSVQTGAPHLIVDTGAARFELGSALRALESIQRGSATLSSGVAFSATVDGTMASGFSQLRRVVVEHADALSAIVIVEGEYGHPSIGGAISGGRRLEFAAGSSAVTVREWIDWEGQRCAFEASTCGNGLNAVALNRWRIELAPSLGAPTSLTMQAALANPPISTTATGAASMRQIRRDKRQDAQRFELGLPGMPLVLGTRADAGIAMLNGPNGTLAVAIQAMADYEPQALRRLANGALALDLADDSVWLAARQGTFAHYRIGAYASKVSFDDAASELWPALHAPLLALADAPSIAASRATEEFPVGALHPRLHSYDVLLHDLLQRTQQLRHDRGLEGLMTYGLHPRNWGNPVLSDEIDCGQNDPTPNDDWDDSYWCATWTDYHNASAASIYAALRHSDPRPIHALTTPAAMRSLHTQMLRCAPDDPMFYCGMLATGYGAYRNNFNSTHGYTESLIFNYWMSGDRTIVERLQQGARTARGFYCPSRNGSPPGPTCTATTPISDAFAGVNDRTATQFFQQFRFLGLASEDASFLDDWTSNTARALTQNFALVQNGGAALGFLETSGGGSTTIINGPGSYESTQLWMAALYDANQWHRLAVDTGNRPLGAPEIAPRTAHLGFARALLAIGSTAPGNGSPNGIWPNTVDFTFSGARVGGTLTALAPGWSPLAMPSPCNDDCLYPYGKSPISTVFARSADDSGDPALRIAAWDFVDYTLNHIDGERLPMSKATGELFGRLHAAVARLNHGDSILMAGFENF
jgi:hypothetical protein